MIYIVSDTHFGHENIIGYCNRPFINAKEMDWEMVKRWNEVVKPQDHVWHLGDVYMGGTREYINFVLGSLNGKKRLILGNHDNGQDQILQRHFEKIVAWRDFKEYGILLTHMPLHPESIIKDRVNVHGHIHNRQIGDKKYRCVCVEHTNYAPIPIDTVLRA